MDILDIIKALGPIDRCGAKTRSGEPCKNAKMQPAGRCRMHGGASLRGIASPRYVHGKYSKYLLARLVYAAQHTDYQIPVPTEQELAETLAEMASQPTELAIDSTALDSLLAAHAERPPDWSWLDDVIDVSQLFKEGNEQ
jgi:hypothetical protein